MTFGRVIRAKLERMKRDLLHFVTLQRREKALTPYLLRLFILAVLIVILPIKKFVQLGVVGGLLATMKTVFAAGVVILGLVIAFALGEAARRRRRWETRRRAAKAGRAAARAAAKEAAA